MVTVFFNASNFTVFHVPISPNFTRLVSLPKRPTPETLHRLIKYFSSYTLESMNTTLRSSIPRGRNPELSLTSKNEPWMLGLILCLLIVFVFMILFLIINLYKKQRRFYSSTNSFQSEDPIIVHESDAEDTKTNVNDKDTKSEMVRQVFYHILKRRI